MIVHLSDHIERAIYRRGEYEPEVTAAFRQLVGKGSIVFDVGAHVGYYTLIAAARVGQNGSVHSFEPVPAIFRRLHNNVAINTFGDIHLVNRALSDSDRRLSIYPASGNNSGTSSVLPGQDKFAEPLFVEVTTVDQYVTDTSLSHVDLLKIDVEGWELNVLKGAGQSLKVYRPDVITEMSDPFFRQAGYDEEAVITFMGGHGYSAFRIANTEGAFPYAYFSCAPRLDLPPWNGGFRAVFS